MIKLIATTAAVLTLAAGAALAQSSAPSTGGPTVAPSAPAATVPAAPAAKTAPVVMLEPAVEAKFKGFDKDSNGALDGAEVAGFKADMTKIDTDKDGKISKAEFAAAVKAGVIK